MLRYAPRRASHPNPDPLPNLRHGVPAAYPGNQREQVEAYLAKYKADGVIADYRIMMMSLKSDKEKTLDKVLEVVDKADKFNFGRRDVFVVVAGGAISDIVGFAASIYKRRCPYIKIPTTLVGLVDAGIGIKVGVNYEGHKNFIGAYLPPLVCLNDTMLLYTLPERELRCGVAEIVKMALVKDRALFELIEKHYGKILDKLFDEDVDKIFRLAIKAMLEELQPNLYEYILRRLPDFGHEFGHLIEGYSNFRIAHGEAVAIGMALSCSIASRKGIFSEEQLNRVLNLLLKVGQQLILNYDLYHLIFYRYLRASLRTLLRNPYNLRQLTVQYPILMETRRLS